MWIRIPTVKNVNASTLLGFHDDKIYITQEVKIGWDREYDHGNCRQLIINPEHIRMLWKLLRVFGSCIKHSIITPKVFNAAMKFIPHKWWLPIWQFPTYIKSSNSDKKQIKVIKKEVIVIKKSKSEKKRNSDKNSSSYKKK